MENAYLNLRHRADLIVLNSSLLLRKTELFSCALLIK